MARDLTSLAFIWMFRLFLCRQLASALNADEVFLNPLAPICRLPLVKGDDAVQSLITDASEALGLWRRTVGRDLEVAVMAFTEHGAAMHSGVV